MTLNASLVLLLLSLTERMKDNLIYMQINLKGVK